MTQWCAADKFRRTVKKRFSDGLHRGSAGEGAKYVAADKSMSRVTGEAMAWHTFRLNAGENAAARVAILEEARIKQAEVSFAQIEDRLGRQRTLQQDVAVLGVARAKGFRR